MTEAVVGRTVVEAAHRLGVKPSAVRKAIARGTLRATTRGGRFSLYEYVITDDALDAYESEHGRRRVALP